MIGAALGCPLSAAHVVHLQAPGQLLSSASQTVQASIALILCAFAKEQFIRAIFILVKAN